MSIFTSAERRFVQTLTDLSYCNPFLPERIEHELQALGDEFADTASVWSLNVEQQAERANVVRLGARAERLAVEVRERLLQRTAVRDADMALYADLVDYVVYERLRPAFSDIVSEFLVGTGTGEPEREWKTFLHDYQYFLGLPHRPRPAIHEAAHLFAGLFQIHRAFQTIYYNIVGRSMSAARLRAAVWQSVFTHDMRRYRTLLYDRLGDFTTLITGPSGTGKELVARAIGLSRYIPFDPDKQKFADDFRGSFHPLNLSALSPTLIESELFGHRRGAFTGAAVDHAGWLEVCRPLGTVFLDEIGDLDTTIQVKLLRALQTRSFQRLGETEPRQFHGKIIAATNRDLTVQICAGTFREDFYYRLCSDMISTPSLHEQLADCPDDLRHLVTFLLRRILGSTADGLVDEAATWIEKHLGRDYPWPGNIRELEQCVRNLLVRRDYRPRTTRGDESSRAAADPQSELTAALRAGTLTAEELLSRYCTLVYAQTHSYEQTARRLQLDRRTVKAKIDADLLRRLR
jgi:transcriptional regulator with AAA-type ATPase domain